MSDSPATPHTPAIAADLRVVLGRLIRKLREQGRSGDLTPSQRAVLLHLEREGPTTVTALARIEGVRSQSMGATVAALEAAQLVCGTPDPADRRQTLLAMTPACREMLIAGRTAREDWLCRAIDATLAPPERDQLAAILPLLQRLAESPAHPITPKEEP